MAIRDIDRRDFENPSFTTEGFISAIQASKISDGYHLPDGTQLPLADTIKIGHLELPISLTLNKFVGTQLQLDRPATPVEIADWWNRDRLRQIEIQEDINAISNNIRNQISKALSNPSDNTQDETENTTTDDQTEDEEEKPRRPKATRGL